MAGGRGARNFDKKPIPHGQGRGDAAGPGAGQRVAGRPGLGGGRPTRPDEAHGGAGHAQWAVRKGTVQSASAGDTSKDKDWGMKQERRTPQYATQWGDVPVART